LSDAEVPAAIDAANELEALGLTTVWIRATGFFERSGSILDATSQLVVASSVLSIWQRPAADVRNEASDLLRRHPDRVVLGVGVSHRPLVDREHPGRFQQPVAAMQRHLDELDAGQTPVPRERRLIAALGPRMLSVCRDRALGTHPYLVTPEHSRIAREALGPSGVVAPAHVAILEPDARLARERARRHFTSPYPGLPNYRNTLLRLGFSERDLDGAGSDRLVDALVAWGEPEAVARRLRAHLRHGADHVAVQLLDARSDVAEAPRRQWHQLASALDLV
jgi:probable F420-dependent oxidoreductase